MSVIDLITGPWALMPDKLAEIQDIYAAHLAGHQIDVAAIEARIGRPLANKPAAYDVIDTVAVLPIEGVLAPKANMMMDISGGMSMQMMMQAYRGALDDPNVKSIILHMDTPGGSVIGTPEFASLIRAGIQRKPTVAYTDGTMASAGVWIGSAAQATYISGPTVMVGSIGVVAMHRDFSGREKLMGVKTTEITAGRFKRINSQYEPQTTEGRADMQAQVDYLYSLFANAVADHLGVSVEQVLTDMADGRVFIGQQAIAAGLADGMSTLSDLIDAMSRDPMAAVKRPPGSSKAITATTTRGTSVPLLTLENQAMSTATQPTPEATIAALTRASLEASNPTLFGALRQEFTAAGATAERDRIKAVREQSLPGHEALIETLAFDGKTTGPEAALAVLGAHRTAMAKAGAAHFDDAPAAAASSAAAAAAATTAEKSRDQKAAEATAYAAKEGISFSAAYKALGFDS